MTVKGLKELQRKLSRLPAVAKARIRAAMEEGADEIVSMMRSLVPTDSGDLRDSIARTYGRAPKGAMSLGKVQSVGGDLTITIYAGNATAFYSRWVEFGTAAHTAGGKFAGATIPAIAASPFFFVSFRANRKKVKSRITRAINKAAKEVAAGS
ncbi:HK97 gp10 family phage protein [Rhizobium laguerreae]|uniref:HK97-gp10 family putative phage morphogenesis protein n=1 Tax=Rhizobium laguerreae TaxID=1076926 RepID=UPI001C8FB5E0|nr:HK97-gp10 family putative phage morphogenesis protein [Rhizobium laguerreae]MBY3255578.1 HK97 gp10 family phage protein [Rhizobium laguerreae]MBY3282617.1 HK97 gp10 family phage protein [Rhizobium laguerreae]MBY3288971.1 HK97 gp10 family phage protein [Rhizobium laguerreae]